jgi:superfamily II DNA or RNA helicase
VSIVLRPYQTEALAAVEESGLKRPAVVLPTGAGKTVVFAEHVRRQVGRGRRTVILVHRDELATQAAHKIRAIAGVEPGVVKAERDDTGAQTIVASVQTLARSARLARLEPDSDVVVDECHHATARSYRSALEHFGAFDDTRPGVAVGFTATMERGDGTRLGDVWEKIVYQRDIPWMIRKNYLSDVKGIRVSVDDLDYSQARLVAGDYSDADVGAAIMASSSPVKVAEAYAEHATRDDGSYRPGILFAPTVETAHAFAEAFSAQGLRTATVWGAMPTDERRRTLADYEAGRLDVLCNCMVLTEGFDSPRAEVCVVARPTTSAPLYVQMVGRVLRLFPGKTHALVLDVVGASAKHALATLATLTGTRAEPKDGQSLLEAIDAEEERLSAADVTYADGPVTVEAVDLFHGSRVAWQQTDAGYWFIPAGDRYIALQPATDSPDTSEYDIAWYRAAGKGGGWVARGVDLTLGMALAEADVSDDEYTYSLKDRQWRNRRASEKTLAFARQLRIDVDSLPDLKGGTVSREIARKLASKRLDGPIGRYVA